MAKYVSDNKSRALIYFSPWNWSPSFLERKKSHYNVTEQEGRKSPSYSLAHTYVSVRARTQTWLDGGVGRFSSLNNLGGSLTSSTFRAIAVRCMQVGLWWVFFLPNTTSGMHVLMEEKLTHIAASQLRCVPVPREGGRQASNCHRVKLCNFWSTKVGQESKREREKK